MKKFALSLAVVAASGAYLWSQWGGDSGDVLLGLSPANAESGLANPSLPGAAAQDGVAPPPTPAAPQPEPAAVILPAPFVIEKPTPPALPIVAADAPAAPNQTDPADASSVAVASSTPDQPVAPRPAVAAIVTAATADPMPPRPRPRPHAVPGAMPLATRVSMTVAANGAYSDGTFTGPAVDAYYGLVQIQAIVRSGRLVGVKVLQYPSDRRTSVAINRQALPMLRDEAVAAQSANVDIVSGATLTSQAFARSLKGALNQATA